MEDIIDELLPDEAVAAFEAEQRPETRAETSSATNGGEENVQLGQVKHEDFRACFYEMKVDSDSSMDSSASVQDGRKRNPSDRRKLFIKLNRRNTSTSYRQI